MSERAPGDSARATRPAPAVSPSRAPAPPKRSKKKTDACALAKPGDAYDVVFEVDKKVYGVESVTVRMMKDPSTGLSKCLAPGCPKPYWCTHAPTMQRVEPVRHL